MCWDRISNWFKPKRIIEPIKKTITEPIKKIGNEYNTNIPKDYPLDSPDRLRDIDLLHPALRKKVRAALEECHKQQLMVYVFESYRSPVRQQILYDQGRKTTGRVVTNARPYMSWHNYGLAFDLVFDGDERDGIQWSWDGDYNTTALNGDKRSDYARVGEIFESYGFEWGARWKSFREMPHFQMTYGYDIRKCMSMLRNQGLQQVWNQIHKEPMS